MKGNHKIARITSLGALALFTAQVFAAGYKLEFQSASTLADAGDAAVVEDAGTNWYNSAGNVYLPQQVVYSGIEIYQKTRFTGTMTAPSTVGGPTFIATGHATSKTYSTLPGIHYVKPIGKNYAFGISIAPAWGLLKNYGIHGLLRYDLTRVWTRTIDIAPSFSMKINKCWSIGLGPDIHYMAIKSKTMVRTEPLTPNDSISRFTADAWSNYGGHIGVLFKPNEDTRFGLNYRTRITQTLRGYSDFVGTGIGAFENDDFRIKFVIPPTTTFSAYRDLTDCWAIMGTVAFDQWTVLRRYHAENYIQPLGAIPDVYLPQKFHNTWDFSAGTKYKYNAQLLFRGSLKYVDTPTVNATRDVNFPDSKKFGINLGAHYQMLPTLGVDVIVAHVWNKKASIHGVNPVTASVANGHVNTVIDLAGAQLVWNI